MAVTIEKRFTVDAPRAAVWDFLTDPHRVATCLPGASITEQLDEKTFSGNISIKVGPVATAYKGKIRFEHLDRDAGTAELTGRGQDVRGRGGADMRMRSQLTAQGDATEVRVESEVNLTGILAQFGRGMIQDVSDQMFQTFTDRMRQELAAPQTPPSGDESGESSFSETVDEAPESLDVLSLGASAGRRAVGRMVRRPLFWVIVALGGAAITYLLI